jgi:hypothetical protein
MLLLSYLLKFLLLVRQQNCLLMNEIIQPHIQSDPVVTGVLFYFLENIW